MVLSEWVLVQIFPIQTANSQYLPLQKLYYLFLEVETLKQDFPQEHCLIRDAIN